MSVKFEVNESRTFVIEDDENEISGFEETEEDKLYNLNESNQDLENNQIYNSQVYPKNQHFSQSKNKQRPNLRHNFQTHPKKQISYDDILLSMNMKVVDGKLEMLHPNSKENNYKAQIPYSSNTEPPVNENNYIYNKYFKDYNKKQQNNQMPRTPMTPQEYRYFLIKKHNDLIQQRNRINQIKSKKLLFSTNNINVSNNKQHHDLNKLFKFVGKK